MKRVFIALVVIIIAGCDSGGSSSGSSANVTSSNTTSPGNIGAQYAGTYRGTIEGTYTATALGLSDSDSTNVTIIIDSNGNVIVRAEGRTYDGTLDSDRITAVVDVKETYEDISCNGTVNVNAQISGDTISGSANGDGDCSQGSISTPVRVAGVLNASK